MIFYFYGENSYAIKQRIDAIKAQYVSKMGGDGDMQSLDMTERPLSDLLNALGVMPMFVSSRLLIVRGLNSHKLQKDQVEKLLKSVSDSTTVIIVDDHPDKRSVYFKSLSKIKNAKSFMSLAPHLLVAWVKDRVEQLEGSIDNPTITLLIERVGADQWQLSQELQKLCAYDSTITKESIDELVVPNLQQTAFMMIDAIMQKNAKKAAELYDRLHTAGEADQMILGAIVYQYRVLVLAKDNEGKGSSWQKELGISPYAATKAQNLVRNSTMPQLKNAYQRIVNTDMSIKTGMQTSTDAMQQLIIDLIQV